jgi:hypothetical protein
MRNHRLATLLLVLLCATLLPFAGGCASPGQAQQVHTVIDLLQARVDLAQGAVDALRAKLDELPPDAPERSYTEEALADASALLARLRFDLALAALGADIVLPPAPNE